MPSQFAVACCAPPLTDELLAKYQTSILTTDGELRNCLETLYQCVARWWELPESTGRSDDKIQMIHKGQRLEQTIVPLELRHIRAMDAQTPYMRELTAMEPVLEPLTGDLRNMAFHLLWFAKELTLDREPLTSDKLVST